MLAIRESKEMAKQGLLERWITEVLSDSEKDKACSRILLMHMHGHGEGKEIDSAKITIPGGKYDPVAMAKRFRSKAENYAAEMSGVQSFQLCAFYGSNEPLAFQPFVVNMKRDQWSGGLVTEAPDKQGELQQSMRQREMSFQQLWNRQQQMDMRSDRMLDLLTNGYAKLQHENMQMVESVKDMIMSKITDDRKFAMEKMEFERATMMREKLMKMAPPLANSLFGKEIFPQGTVDTVIVETLIDKIAPEQMEMLLAFMPEEARVIISDRIQKHIKEKTELENRRKELPIYRGNPEDEINGGSK